MTVVRRSLLAVALATATVLGTAAPAQAHSSLVGSTPAEGETLTTLPEQFSVTANETLLDLGGEGRGFALLVRDAEGLYYGDGCVTVRDATMSTPAALGEPGEYALVWQWVSGDGHSVSGEVPFTWQPSAGATPATGGETMPSCGGEAETPAPPEPSGDSSLGLWLGGALLAALAGGVVAYVMATRTRGR